MNIRSALIVINGDLFEYSQIKDFWNDYDIVIACDGASTRLKKHGIVPTVVIGDFDSAPYPVNSTPSETEYLKFPIDKDFTDSELALDYAKKIGCSSVTLVGLNGTRTDHFLVNIFLMAKRKYRNLKINIRDKDQAMYVARGQMRISGLKGDTISFLPIFGPAIIKKCEGLRYDLTKYKLSMFGNQGISNVMQSSDVQIDISKGKLLVIHQMNGSPA